jgi:hypothetical protein
MSQSDYIRCKRIERQLEEFVDDAPNKVPYVLDSGKYILYKEYSLETQNADDAAQYEIDQDTTKLYNPIVYGMPRSQCIEEYRDAFKICDGTDSRPNRRPLQTEYVLQFRKPKVDSIPKEHRMNWNKKPDKISYIVACEKCKKPPKITFTDIS